ncbi:unnamed protein product [Effrenium voratum]|uniref:Uncharacterized protein n=1 Tax=Effrenium voratum TaxID=2562239 RepID=A0AA36IH30_9DINO|nr:unnamed protein product [Effrenium voratum]
MFPSIKSLCPRELYARRAENAEGPFTEEQYQLLLKCAECCEEAAVLSQNALGRREGAFAHLRLAVHLLVRVPTQATLGARRQSLVELSDRHLGKALRLFDELKDEREVAVCHFHMADLVLQEQCMPGAPPLSKARLTSAQRHAKRSAEYWQRLGCLDHAKDFISSHVRVARLLAYQRSAYEAVAHLALEEEKLVRQAKAENAKLEEGLFQIKEGTWVVLGFRREMSRLCQFRRRSAHRVGLGRHPPGRGHRATESALPPGAPKREDLPGSVII